MGAIIPNLSVDCVVFGFDYSKLNVLLTKRELIDEQSGKVIFTDFTVQGHHVMEGENLNEAASRVLKDKTGLENIYLEQFYTFGETDRMRVKGTRYGQKSRFRWWLNMLSQLAIIHLLTASGKS